MEPIIIEGTQKTPSVNFDANSEALEIKGRSIPENSIDFYKPLIEWLEEYAKEAKEKTVVNVQLEYFNTSSSKCILDVFKKLEAINKMPKNEVVINWYYEEDDEDMLEAGEDYESIIRVPFKMIEVVN